MILVYNEKGLHDVVLCIFDKENTDKDVEHEVIGDVVKISQDGVIIGINILNAKDKFAERTTGVTLETNTKFEQDVRAYLAEQAIELPKNEKLNPSFIIGHVLACEPHPDSYKLSVCQVDLGSQKTQIVCGAANVVAGQKVVVASLGTMMPTGLIIEPSVLRKVPSNGMICSARELHLPETFLTEGIMVLPESATVGMNFFEYFKMEMMG